ncbi:unnamed protein product [Cuscuta epithymum]|uniref:Uncharacterized protein n=1 Tax=Cuscuta epithymum TaxID=186058 RepID=A0AAV0CIA3_9ASTE|nr:unnamed protein product [Cuscuta epithymum]
MGIAPLTPISAKQTSTTGKSKEDTEYSLKPQAPLYVRPNSTLSNVLPYNGGHPLSPKVSNHHITANHMPPPNITERPQPPPFPPATLSPHNNHTISICNQTSPVSSSFHSEPYMNTCYPIYPYVSIPTTVYPPP